MFVTIKSIDISAQRKGEGYNCCECRGGKDKIAWRKSKGKPGRLCALLNVTENITKLEQNLKFYDILCTALYWFLYRTVIITNKYKPFFYLPICLFILNN